MKIIAITNLNEIVTLEKAHAKDGRHLKPDDLSIIRDAAVVYNDDEILWVGKSQNLPKEYLEYATPMHGHILTPELVDSHTHLVFGGDRSEEYAQRINGVSYEEIAKSGGGIIFTMNCTNSESIENLFNQACVRIEQINSYGVGTIEIKSGYGLSFEKEKEITLLIDRLKKKYHPKIQIFNTYLAAHDIPKTYSKSSDYMEKVVLPLLTEMAPLKIIDAVDIFHEKNYFTTEDATNLFRHAKSIGIKIKIHADELNDNNGASLASSFDALSADHLLKISPDGIDKISKSKTVATLLPGTAFFLGKSLAPARNLLDSGAKVAIASDFNPGSCHCDNLLLIASISAAQLKINQAELWASITLNAAGALNLSNQGAVIKGMKPRFSIFKAEKLSHVTYHWGKNFNVNFS